MTFQFKNVVRFSTSHDPYPLWAQLGVSHGPFGNLTIFNKTWDNPVRDLSVHDAGQSGNDSELSQCKVCLHSNNLFIWVSGHS